MLQKIIGNKGNTVKGEETKQNKRTQVINRPFLFQRRLEGLLFRPDGESHRRYHCQECLHDQWSLALESVVGRRK